MYASLFISLLAHICFFIMLSFSMHAPLSNSPSISLTASQEAGVEVELIGLPDLAQRGLLSESLSPDGPRWKKALQKRKEKKRKGNKKQKGGGDSLDALGEKILHHYSDTVRARIRSFWILPQYLQEKEDKAILLLRITPQGKARIAWVRRPQSALFQRAVLTAIQEAQPFPAPQKKILSHVQEVGFKVGFPIL